MLSGSGFDAIRPHYPMAALSRVGVIALKATSAGTAKNMIPDGSPPCPSRQRAGPAQQSLPLSTVLGDNPDLAARA